MVDLTFISRATNFVPLALLRKISSLPSSDAAEEISYLGEEGITALKSEFLHTQNCYNNFSHAFLDMDLVTRGRLSVQRVGEDAWKAIEQLAEKGGWEDTDLRPTAAGTKRRKENSGSDDGPSKKVKTAPKRKGKSTKPKDLDQEDTEPAADETEAPSSSQKRQAVKRKRQDTESDLAGLRRSTRTRS